MKISSPYRGSSWNPHRRGLNGFDPDCTVDGLSFALRHSNVGRSKIIWDKVLLPRTNQISGIVESSTRQDFVNSEYESQVSKLGELVINSRWLPDGAGNFVRPSELSLDELPDDLRKDDNLAQMLSMRPSSGSLRERDDIPEYVKQIVEMTEGRSAADVARGLELLDEEKQKQQDVPEALNPEDFPPEFEDSFDQPSVNRRQKPTTPDAPEEKSPADRRIDTKLDISEETTYRVFRNEWLIH